MSYKNGLKWPQNGWADDLRVVRAYSWWARIRIAWAILRAGNVVVPEDCVTPHPDSIKYPYRKFCEQYGCETVIPKGHKKCAEHDNQS